jgi:hypothetical protein
MPVFAEWAATYSFVKEQGVPALIGPSQEVGPGLGHPPHPPIGRERIGQRARYDGGTNRYRQAQTKNADESERREHTHLNSPAAPVTSHLSPRTGDSQEKPPIRGVYACVCKMWVQYKDPGLVRYDIEPRGRPISIVDSLNGKTLTLDPAQKSPFLVQSPRPKGREARRDVAASIIDNFRQLANKNGEPVGEKSIGDVRARGFRVKEEGQTMTVWVDPRAGLQLVIESAGSQQR